MNRFRLDPETLSNQVEASLEAIYIAAEGASLREEDRRKAVEVTAMLLEMQRAADRWSATQTLTLVDAAAGKSYLGLLAAKLWLEPAGRDAVVITLERDAARVERSRQALELLGTRLDVDCRLGDVSDACVWPAEADLVVALHACGPASDQIIEQVIAGRARSLLLVPCCTSQAVAAAERARIRAERLGVPRQAPVRRRFIQACVDAERTWRLEAAGYETEVVEFVPPTLTPHNLLWRARRVGEPVRMRRAQDHYEAWLQASD